MSSHSNHDPAALETGSQKLGERSANSARAVRDATAGLLTTTALKDLSVAQIIQAAGVSRATFYFHFASKFAVVATLVEQAIEEMYDVAREVERDRATLSRQAVLRRRITASAHVWDAHRPVLKATVENWYIYPELGEAWLALIGGLTADIGNELEEHGGRSGLSTNPQAVGAVLAWMTERCLYNIGDDQVVSRAERADHLEALARAWIAVMAPEE